MLFDLSSLIIFKNYNIKFNSDYLITINQINNNEILFNNENIIYILNLKNYNIKLKFKYETGVSHSFLLKDKSIVICGVNWAKRYSPKTFEILNNFYKSKEEFWDPENPCLGETYIFFIKNTLQLSDTKLLFILNYGLAEINELLF